MNVDEMKDKTTLFFGYMGDPSTRHKALAMMTDDATWWIPGIGTWNKEQLAAGMGAADACFVGAVTPTVLGITAEGNRVAFESLSQAEIVNGERYENRYHCLVVFEGERIAQVREYCDTKYAAEKLGPLLSA